MRNLLLFLFISIPIFSQSVDVNFSPQGNVKNVQQVKVSFSRQMVPLGTPRNSADIFIIDCPIAGKGRWLDDRNYVYEFPKSLEAGIKCRFQLKPDIKSLDGKKITGSNIFEFSTGGPAIISTRPYEGAYIEEDQIFAIKTDTAVDPLSFAGNVSFAIEGLKNKVEAILLSDNSQQVKDIIASNFQGKKPKNTYFIKSKLLFPNNKKVELVWDKGVSSQTGIQTTERQTLPFTVQEPFTATFSCDRENQNAACIPFATMYLGFTASIPYEQVSQIKLRGNNKTYDAKVGETEEKDKQPVSQVFFDGPFPENAKFTIEISGKLTDEAGRALSNANKFPMKVATAHFPPLAKFAAPFGIIEAASDASLPVTLRNLESGLKARIIRMKPSAAKALENVKGGMLKIKPEETWHWLNKVHQTRRENTIFTNLKLTEKFDVKKPNGAKAFEVMGIPLKEKGLYAVEIESEALGKSLLGRGSMFVPTVALVTNLAVHFKKGQENSLVWVTTLNQAKPVANARVTIRDCKNKLLHDGITDNNGTMLIKKDLKEENCSYQTYGSGLMVFAELGDDFSFVHSNWVNGIESWRFNLPYGEVYGSHLYHTVLDRPLFRAGETVSMKHIGRVHTTNGFTLPNKSSMPTQVKIVHDASGKEFLIPMKWDGNAHSDSTWKIPKEAVLGEYSIYLIDAKYTISEKTSSFRVEEFRVPLLKGKFQLPSERLVQTKNFKVGTQVQYLAGGAASGLGVKFKYWVEKSWSERVEDYSEFEFGTEDVKEGRISSNSYSEYEEETEEATINPKPENNKIKSQESSLDKLGVASFTVNEVPDKNYVQIVPMELEYRDPNGEIQTIFDSVKIYPSSFKIGIKTDSWLSDGKTLKVSAIVLDLKNKPVAGKEVSINAFSKKYYSHRKRLVGGFYSFENYTEITKLGKLCSGKTDSKGLLFCEKESLDKGTIVLEAKLEGEKVTAQGEVWVSGDDEFRSYEVSDNDRIDLLPEQRNYEPGETAKFQVRMPFAKATALVTVEREGVLDRFVTELSGKSPIVEIPMKGNYAPNVFISVLAVRGRVADPKPTATIDLAKPAHKLGYSHVKVGWKNHELKVRLDSDKEVYRTNDKVRVKIKVQTTNGQTLPKDSEIAIAAVDEGLLDLKDNSTWEILPAMMRLRTLNVNTSTAQMQVVGRRHYGLKSVPAGGGGGRDRTRELFDTLLYWNPKIILDENGEAEIFIKTNDSLTSFRIVGIATAGLQLFGHGATNIRVSQDLMLFSGIPPVVREGDEYYPEISLRNASNSPMVVKVDGYIKELSQNLTQNTITLEPNETKQVFWNVKIPFDAKLLNYEFSANSDNVKDKLKITQKVISAIPVTVQQGTIFQLENQYSSAVEMDADAIPGRGGVNLAFSNSLLHSMGGMQEYMELYPYNCLEQQISKSIALGKSADWQKIMSKLPTYLDESGFAKYFPGMWYGDPVLTAYILSISHERNWTIPDETRNFMLGALVGFVEGRISRNGVLPTADLVIRKLIALEALSRYGMATKEHISTLKFQPNLLPVSALIDYWDILFRIKDVPDKDKKAKGIEGILKSRMSMQGTVMKFQTESSDKLWWLMISPDQNSVRLLLSLLHRGIWKADIGRLVQGALSRQVRGRWDTTPANAWGKLAVEKFAKEYEKEKVTGTTEANFGTVNAVVSWQENPKGKETLLAANSGKSSVSIQHSGKGKPWITLQVKAAVPLKSSVHNGYSLEKSFEPIERKDKSKWSVGDVIRVKIKIKSDIEMTWAVLNDPIPTGASILTGALRGNSSLTQGESSTGYSSFEERSFESYRVYYEYAPNGEWTLEYTIRLNQDGNFNLPPTRIESMYSPDVYGALPNPSFTIVK